MISKNYYHRSFIILQAKDSGYGILKSKEPAGYCKMEIRGNKGKMTIHIQDLKPIEPEGGYDVFLVSIEEGIQPVHIATVEISQQGRGECIVDFDPNNIEDSGQTLEKYHAIAVVIKSYNQNKLSLSYPLVGYANKRLTVDWDGEVNSQLMASYKAHVDSADDDIPELQVEIHDDVKTDMDDERYKDAYDSTYKDLTDSDIWQEIDDNIDEIADINALEDDIDDIGVIEEIIDGEEISEEQEKQDDTTADLEGDAELDQQMDDTRQLEYQKETLGHNNEQGDYKKQQHIGEENLSKGTTYWDQTKNYYNRLFEMYNSVSPFNENPGQIEWIRIHQQVMPNYNGYYTYYTTGMYNQHYLIGIEREGSNVKHVIYGIPSTYSVMPPMALIGFSRWLPSKDEYGMGYWLLYIDAKTGCVIYPN